ncbi:hypothetical protein [Streptococcus sinensis]|uniref:hypothetical protein n=1 Tax=Streptococcus sinensis TaxID=176090 RepID=UPI001C2E4267|nr:hypothetical protein [Streptococcus sinensis]MCD1277290.1 hypothetical protein [Streptococcus sinensis]
MARKKLISDEELIEMFEHYLEEKCNSNINLFKIPQFGEHLRTNGYSKVADTTIRRNDAFRGLLADLKAQSDDEDFQTIITYKTLDVENFMRTNRTSRAMKVALMELNRHYKRIVEVALQFKDEADKLREINKKLELKTEKAENDKKEMKELQDEVVKLRSILKTSVYPEIANELLREEGLLKSDTTKVIADEFLVSQIITTDTEIDFRKEAISHSGSQSKVVSIKNMLDNATKH